MMVMPHGQPQMERNRRGKQDVLDVVFPQQARFARNFLRRRMQDESAAHRGNRHIRCPHVRVRAVMQAAEALFFLRAVIEFTADCAVIREKAAAIRVILIIVTVAAGGFLALLFRTDYDLSGIVTIFAIYMFYPKKVKGMGIGVFVLTLLASIIEAAAFLDMIPVYFYNGTRGKQMKYFFYIFYPAHLFLLAMIARAMGLWA